MKHTNQITARITAAEVNPHKIEITETYGYAEGMWLSGEYELHNIEVLPQFRGQGKGYELMQKFLTKCKGSVFLEVATKNTAAIKLYEKCGFVEISRRKGYYENDDAIVMKLDFN
jgi:ribosomal-protein-alanine N-acetyltransferase